MAKKKPVKSSKPKKKPAAKPAPKKAAKPVKAAPKPRKAKPVKPAPAPKPSVAPVAKPAKPAPKPIATPVVKPTLTLKSTKPVEPSLPTAKIVNREVKEDIVPETKPVLLSGGNPQIPKGEGDDPVQTYIAEMPGWKHDIGQRLDTIITRNVPGVRKAVKWNSPFYGVESTGDTNNWFMSFHCFTKYVKLAFFSGAALQPLPPGESTQKDVRYLDIHEHDKLDEAQLAAWVKQASKLPGWRMG